MFRRIIRPAFLSVLILIGAEPKNLAGQYAPTATDSKLPAHSPPMADLPKLAWAARDDYRPITNRQITTLRTHLRTQARRLEHALGAQGNLFRQQWKDYLKWELLEQQLSPTAKIDRQALSDLERVLKQFRKNQSGLERPEFTRTARAIEQLRVTVPWAMTIQTRDLGKDYQRLMTELMTQLQRHRVEATTETSWKIGRILGRTDQLGQSVPLVEALRAALVQPNVLMEISETLVQQAAASQPVHDTQPVRDYILGTAIKGTAHTIGSLHIRTIHSREDIRLEVKLSGDTRSRTRGYQGSIRIHSSGNTRFVTSKRVVLGTDSFQANRAVAHANTQTKIHSIHKTGGRLGQRLVERIAWNKTCQSKRCAEQIAARHAEAKIMANFDEQVALALANAREGYEQKIWAPLTRRNMELTQLQMSSQTDRARIEAALASRHQLASAGASAQLTVPRDMAVRIHQSAVNNYMAAVMAGITIQQETVDHPPKVIGDLPPWMSNVLLGDRFAGKRPSAGASTGPTGATADTNGHDHGEFLPWSITLNAERPVSIWFDNQQLILRLRAASLISGERKYKNWDFILRYDVLRQERTIVLRRTGKIEVFPTGFDPRWDKRMSSAKSGFRSTLARNMNARADRGESFPLEIPIQPIRLPEKLGIQGELTLQQLDCNNHWLTLSWTLP